MAKFIIGLITGGFLGAMWMCLASIVDDVDNLAEMMEEEAEEEQEEPEVEEDEYCY